jgi:hypothetical protein
VIPSHKKLIAVLTRGGGKLILSHREIVLGQFPLSLRQWIDKDSADRIANLSILPGPAGPQEPTKISVSDPDASFSLSIDELVTPSKNRQSRA